MEELTMRTGFHLIDLPKVQPTITLKKRRKCAIVTCKSILSIYNFKKYCFVHQSIVDLLKQDAYVKKTDLCKNKR